MKFTSLSFASPLSFSLFICLKTENWESLRNEFDSTELLIVFFLSYYNFHFHLHFYFTDSYLYFRNLDL